MDLGTTTVVAAVALGIAAQVVAERFKLPAILPLLVFGIAFGPAGLAVFAPDSLGHVFEVLIHLGVAVILFEGGLSLDLKKLARVGAPVRNLLTIGVAVTGVGAAWLAHALLDMPWPSAALFGAVMTVTGPTVIVPLLRHLIAPREVKTILLSEGLIVDPIGAVLAYLVLQWIEYAGVPMRQLASQLLEVAGTGIILGFAAGALARIVARSRLVGGELRNLSILAILMVCYLLSEQQAEQSGILAAMVMGLTLSASDLPDLVSVKAFKGQLTTLLISMLFILLAGQLDFNAVLGLGWRGAVVVAAMIVVLRPAAVAASIWPHHIDLKGRTVLAMMAPRGIVAAAVASLAARQMDRAGIAGGAEVEGLVYLAILVTGAWSTAMAIVLPRLLGYINDPARRRAVLVGANRLSEELAGTLAASGRTTLVVDAVSWRLDRVRSQGLTTVCGDARDALTYEEAGVERDSLVVAMTTNDELNLLVAELVRAEFGVEHPVVALRRPPEDLGRRSRAWIDLLGARSVDVSRWNRSFETKTVHAAGIDPKNDTAVTTLQDVERDHPKDVLRLAGRKADELGMRVDDGAFGDLDRLLLLVKEGRAWDSLETAIDRDPERPTDET